MSLTRLTALAALILATFAFVPAAQAINTPDIDALIADEEALSAGTLRFAQNCTYCHGANGVGGKHKKLQCRDFKPDYLYDTISNGLESGSFFMPPWDHFSEEKRWELVAFIMSLGQLESCG